jgi:hypothetical protein
MLTRVEGEYHEMPGLRLTIPQAQRLWGLQRLDCEALMGSLVETGFLVRTRDGAFVRRDVNSPALAGDQRSAAGLANPRAESVTRA